MSTSYPYSWQAQRGAWLNQQGNMTCNQSDQSGEIVYGSTGWTTQRIEATVNVSQGAAGLMCRFFPLNLSGGGFYAFTVYPTSSTLALELVSSNLNRASIAQYSSLPIVTQQNDYKLTFDMQGSNLRAWVNDIKYFDVTEGTFAFGQVGLESQYGQAQFRDVHIMVTNPSGNYVPVTLPTDFGAYCSVDDVLGLVKGVPTDDIVSKDEVYMYIKGASDMINRETYSSFGQGIRLQERYDGDGQYTLVLRHSPVIRLHLLQIFDLNSNVIRSWSPGLELGTTDDSESVASLIQEKNFGMLTIPPSSTPNIALQAQSGLWYNPFGNWTPNIAQLDFINRFGRGVRNIVVDYTYGYQTVPEVIRWAVAKYVAALILTKRGNKDSGGATQLTIEGLTVSFMHRQGISAPYGGQIQMWITDVKDAINEYRRRPVMVL